MIKIFKTKASTGNFFETSPSSVYIDITSNRLSELTQYTETPIELKTFLLKHAVQLKNNLTQQQKEVVCPKTTSFDFYSTHNEDSLH